MKRFTVIGSTGFIGSHIVKLLKDKGHDVFTPDRNDESIYQVELGVVIYCAGHGDCKNSPAAVFEANSILLNNILQKSSFERMIYLSSTRVYMNQELSDENADVLICSDDNRRLFNLTKLVSEELCLRSGKDVVIVRPSNVYGLALNSPLFLPAIIRNAINNGVVDMYVKPTYAKDYVSVDDLSVACLALSEQSVCKGIYNIASGENISAAQISEVLRSLTDCEINWHEIDFPREEFATVNITKLQEIIPDYKPRKVLADLALMINEYKNELNK